MMMQVMEPGGHPPGVGGGAASGWARPCDACRSTACSVYCRFEALYLCGTCDRQAHATDLAASRHERVWVCEACGRAPATLTCKADAAALCTACDADVHSANPLTRRHHRLPIVPIEGAAGAAGGCWRAAGALFRDDDVEEAGYHSGGGNGYHALFGGEVDEYLDLAGFNSCADEQNLEHQHQQEQMQQQQQQHNFQDYEAPEHSSVSLNHSVSVSSMEASVVPDGSTAAGPDTYTSRGTPLDLFAYPQHHPPSYMAAAAAAMMPQFTHPAMDREARVLRYREKRKMRKFEKTIRYASRKAYAETRPRIKGRFAKRSADVEIEVDQLFSPSVLAAAAADTAGYGVVPSY